ncbi:hypothetical protein NEOLEDRAFT_1028705, partial [Neolentinus lepideus HHB14362 ss-1]
LRLTEVLYSPEVGYTLISVGRLDEAGFTLTFGQGKCLIQDEDGEVVGEIPRSSKGLVLELHKRMGHISPDVARRLVEKGFVTGITLDTSSDKPFFCESCIVA